MELVFWILIAVLVVLRTSVEIRTVLQERRSRRIEAEELAHAEEDARLHPPPPYDSEKAEQRRIELLAAGFRESSPGIFTFPAHPLERARHLETLRARCHYVRPPKCRTGA